MGSANERWCCNVTSSLIAEGMPRLILDAKREQAITWTQIVKFTVEWLHHHVWICSLYYDVMIWKYFPYYWPLCERNPPVASVFPHKGPEVQALIFSCDQAALWMVQSVHPSVRPSVTPFWLCSHHCIIMKFSGVITNDRSDVHAKGQGQRSKVKVTNVNTQLSSFRT